MDQPKALPLYAAPHPFLYLTMTGFVFSILPTYFRKFAPGCHVDTSKLTHSILKSWLSFPPCFILGPFPSCMITCGNDTYYHLSSHPLKSSYFSLLSFSICSLHLCLPKLVATPPTPHPLPVLVFQPWQLSSFFGALSLGLSLLCMLPVVLVSPSTEHALLGASNVFWWMELNSGWTLTALPSQTAASCFF